MATTNTKRIQGTEVLRIFAIIMVVACHTQFLLPASGGIGNKIFFVMGGLLSFFSILGFGFDRGFSAKSVFFYWIKRIIRIVPSYWLVIIVTFFLRPEVFILNDFSTDQSLILNLFFVRAYGHLWFMQQMMIMYLLAPFFMIGLELIRKGIFKGKTIGAVFNVALLIALAILEKQFFTENVLRLSGEGSHAQFQVWMFFVGIAVGYLCMILKEVSIGSLFVGIYLVLFLVINTIAVVPGIGDAGMPFFLFFQDEWVRTVMAAALLLLFYISKEGIFGTLGKIKIIGVFADASFGVYLVHFFILGYFTQWGTFPYFLINFGISYLSAIGIHFAIDKPISKIRLPR